MTLMSSISMLTTSVDQLTSEANVTKAALDAKVAQADAEVVAAQAEQATAEAARDEAATQAATAATHLATMKTGVTYQGISAILAEKAVTAVDVFVYDTSLDSDGGAWRERCQHTSWYNEPLNTATRGARREFPAVSVIVAETGKVTIYDGDDPALPMWMVFGLGVGSLLTSFNSVSMRNGIMCAGSPASINFSGLLVARFLNDDAIGVRGHVYWNLHMNVPAISTRNGTWQQAGSRGFLAYDSSSVLVNPSVNDVTMTVLPDAPVDPATGLPVPTIAVGCGVTGQPNGGTSIIKHDGTVIDIVASTGAGGYACFDLGFGRDGQLVTTQSYSRSYGYVHIFDALPDTDIPTTTTPAGARTYSYGVGYPSVRGMLLGGPNIYDMMIDGEVVSFALGDKLSHLLDDGATKAKSMVAYAASKYTSGWLVGDIKGAWLASTDSASLSDVNLLPADILQSNAGWTLKPNTTVSGGLLTIDAASDGYWYENAKFPFQIEGGKAYRLVITVDSMAPSNDQLWIYLGGGGILVDAVSVSAAGAHEILHIASKDATMITIEDRHNTATTFVVSQLELYEADTDRSVNADPLIVNGMITRSPVADGAELVGYSGFSDVNYLEASLRGYLPAGSASPLCMMGWFKTNSSGSVIAVGIDIPDVFSGGPNGFGLTKGWSGHWAERATNVGYTSTPVTSNEWQFLVLVREPSGTKIYSNGVLTGSTGAVYPTSESPVLRIGNALDGSGFFNGAMALLRISGTAPTSDQIARIYEDERKLFQVGAQCTLSGTSDAVTALAHDPKTNLLHVGTSAGRSTFDGLLRVANTETPVTTAISAVNDLIAEQ